MTESTEQTPLTQFAEKAYLGYAMYVILDRALPHIEDGLKPVQRRIVYAMSEMNLTQNAKFKKSARTVGDVLGKYHPHGDMACYEAMVLMAQSFSYRYPLVEGQGNWGTTDEPKSFAAMRYTEARLTSYAQTLLGELRQGTVNWTPNFDGTLNEPELLPARVPNVLLNGASGIAVGMATDIPPHNLNEVVSACIHLLENPDAEIRDLCQHIQGPDYPTEAEIITPREQVQTIYETGSGSLRMRARYRQEHQGDIVIDALPYQVSGSKVMTQIAQQIKAKKLPMITDLRDESDHQNPIRFVITPKSKQVDVQALMNHLFATTDLEQSYRINFNMIGTDGRPEVKHLKQILSEWLSFRRQTVVRRLEYRLEQVDKRLHMLEGLLTAFLNIEDVIRIIREEDEPKQALITSFDLTETQAEAILNLRLRYLAKLEEQKIKAEQTQLAEEKASLEALLTSDKQLKGLIQEELLADAKRHGDDRCAPLVEREQAQALSADKPLTNEPVTFILSTNGWGRVAKGHDVDLSKLNFKAGDSLLCSVKGQSTQMITLLDSQGRSYTLSPQQLPSARSQGEPLSAHLTLPQGARVIGAMMDQPETQYLLLSSGGYGFRTQLGELATKNRNGKAIIKLAPDNELLVPLKLDAAEAQYIAVVTATGRLLLFEATQVPYLKKGKGNKLIHLLNSNDQKDQVLMALAIEPNHDKLVVYSGKRHLTLKPQHLEAYTGTRGKRGKQLPRGFRQVRYIAKDNS